MTTSNKHIWGVNPASDCIWAMVCGFPGDKGRLRQLLAFQAYIDDSGKGSGPVLVLAGYIATAEKWAAFSVEWKEMLSFIPASDAFKMSEMAQSEDRLEKSSWFYRIIENHVTAAVSCVIRVPDLVNAVRSIDWPPYIKNVSNLENPYYFAFQAIINVLAQYQEKMDIREPVDFIFDEQTEKVRILDAWDLLKASSSPEVRKLMGDTPIYRDDKKVLPLQAADLYAWWVRRWEIENDQDGVKDLKFPWAVKRDIPRLDMRFSEDDLRAELSKGLHDPAVILRASAPKEPSP
ncbi:MAG: DUF3800 domain-containing protein [Nitrospinae bacterium]|nr:DUF3800 domain-containing protein [Nitrospinota bacterium]